MRIRKRTVIPTVLVAMIVTSVYWLTDSLQDADSRDNKSINPKTIPVAVLGDSDSHSYRDKFDNKARGGDFHSVSFNWAEVWNLLRGDEIDPGVFGEWGISYRYARFLHALDFTTQSPKKLDFAYNFAVSGLKCHSLLNSWPYQGQWLLQRLQKNPEFWSQGIVIIRIGINDFGQTEHLAHWESSDQTTTGVKLADNCIHQITAMAHKILDANQGIKIVLVGIARDYYNPSTMRQLTTQRHENIEKVLSHFDNSLIKFSSSNSRVIFVDDFQWMHNYFQFFIGEPNTTIATTLSNGFELFAKVGDHPSNMTLADGHAGTVHQGLWLQHLISNIKAHWNLPISQIKDNELTEIVCASKNISCP
ncbi:MAG: hypothetical protein MI976_21165 [Pseudomonadales bacterium]|nr:hypothetical protein [Pseudomonadales bacterium]